MNRLFFFSIFLCAFCSAVLAGPETEVMTASSVDRSTITVGDRIRYTIELAYPQGTEIQAPGLGVHLGEFEVKDYLIKEPALKNDGMMHTTYEYVSSTFTTGNYTIPPVEIAYKLPSGKTGALLTDKIDILVESVKPSEAGDIKDIKPPLMIKGGLDWWWWVIIGVVASAGMVTGLVFWLKRRTQPKPAVPPRSRYEVAMEELEQLIVESLLEKGEYKIFYFRISEIIRRYLGGRYRFNAPELTTFELFEALRAFSFPGPLFAVIEKFCIEDDLVKFADYVPGGEEQREILSLAHEILEGSKPTAPAAIPEGAGPGGTEVGVQS